MPESALPQPLVDWLGLPHPAVMATVAEDGRPVSVATWYLLEPDGRVLLGLDAKRARLRHLEADPRLSLTVLDRENWYSHLSLQGRIGPVAEDDEWRQIDRLARHYLDKPYPDHERPRVACWMTIERWHAWGSVAERA